MTKINWERGIALAMRTYFLEGLLPPISDLMIVFCKLKLNIAPLLFDIN